MHKLIRGAAPACLAAYRHGLHRWSDLTPTERLEIWTCLEVMQGDRCAYCEAQIAHPDRHIEHFRQRGRYERGTFSWSNLFGSCNRHDSCGKHKDSCGAYDHADLVKPDDEDPDEFFVFVSDGTITTKPGLGQREHRRAEETLRVFNLDAERGPLRHMRREYARGHLQTAEFFRELSLEFDESEWRPLLEQELDAVSHLPFVTVIRHVLVGS